MEKTIRKVSSKEYRKEKKRNEKGCS